MSKARRQFQMLIGHPEQWDRVIVRKADPREFKLTFGIDASRSFENFDAIMPFMTHEYDILRPLELDLQNVIIPSSEAVSLLDDKLNFKTWMMKNGYESLLAQTLSCEPRSFPYVAKASRGTSGDEVRIIKSSSQVQEHSGFLSRRDVFYEEYLEGIEEFCAHFLIADGRTWFRQTVRHHMGRELLVKGRRCFPKRSVFVRGQDRYAPLFLRILNDIGYQGTVCVDYKVVKGAPKIMEINPRIGFSCLPVIDALMDAYLAALGKRKERPYWEKLLVSNRRKYARRFRRWFQKS